MKSHLLIFLTLFSASSIAIDDAERNSIAKKLKQRVVKELSKQELEGYCDLFIEFSHDDRYAKVKKVRGTGDHKVCKAVKKIIKRGQRFKYQQPEKYIRIHVTS